MSDNNFPHGSGTSGASAEFYHDCASGAGSCDDCRLGGLQDEEE